jgi:hypothetical protein
MGWEVGREGEECDLKVSVVAVTTIVANRGRMNSVLEFLKGGLGEISRICGGEGRGSENGEGACLRYNRALTIHWDLLEWVTSQS